MGLPSGFRTSSQTAARKIGTEPSRNVPRDGTFGSATFFLFFWGDDLMVVGSFLFLKHVFVLVFIISGFSWCLVLFFGMT